MKKLFIVLATGLATAACNDTSSDTGTGGSIDSNYMAPDASTDESSNVHPDSVRMDTNNIRPEGREGNSPGKPDSGAATNSNNSGAAKDNTNGTK